MRVAFIILFMCVSLLSVFGQREMNALGLPQAYENRQFKVSTRKFGALIGYQQGEYAFMELGVEHQWKKLKLVKPKTYTLNANLEYNFTNKSLGYKLAGWMKIGRLNLTYGANLCLYTNFEDNKFGFGPAIGYKLLGFHFINGYNFMPTRNNGDYTEFNSIYISVRYFISQNRSFQFKKSK